MREIDSQHPTAQRVVTCYDLLHVSLTGDITDYTDGIYTSNSNTREDYLQAQVRQANYLLDEIGCTKTSHILDIGCGYGRILSQAMKRGAKATGISISPPQVQYCRSKGLEVHHLNYRNIAQDWNRRFTGIVANGSLEHFVQVQNACDGKAEEIWREFFSICHRLLGPKNRLVTTAIHFREKDQVSPFDLIKGPYQYKKESDLYHFSMVCERALGGWFPHPGQLAKCAKGLFQLVREEEATHDYHLTAEYWLQSVEKNIKSNPHTWLAILKHLLRRPRESMDMLRAWYLDQSWMWLFRGNPAPTILFRQTWEAI